jgi:hypothetical protein
MIYLKYVDISLEISEKISTFDFGAADLLDDNVGRRQDEGDELIQVFLERRLDVFQVAFKVAISCNLQPCLKKFEVI